MNAIRPRRHESEYDAALAAIEPFFDQAPQVGTPEADRFDLLALVIADYEAKHWPIALPNPIDAIRYRMETGGFSQADLGRLLGSRQRASDILNHRSKLTMSMASKPHREWKIPAEALLTAEPESGARSG